MGKINEYANAATLSDNDKVIGTDADDSSLTKNFTLSTLNTYLSGKHVSVPATADATGTAGDYAVEVGFLYTCVATNTWERVATAAW